MRQRALEIDQGVVTLETKHFEFLVEDRFETGRRSEFVRYEVFEDVLNLSNPLSVMLALDSQKLG